MKATDLTTAHHFKPKWYHAPSAWCGHIPFAAWLIKELKSGVFVELGTHYGNSYFTFCQAVQENNLATRCFAVDTWEGDPQAGLYGDEVYQTVNEYNSQHYHDFSTLLRMRFDDALSRFEDKSIQLLHIDGLHTYEAVKHDYESWLPKMDPNGVIIFHDISEIQTDFGVWRLWGELKEVYPTNLEFTHSHGLGVIQLGGDGLCEKLKIFQSSTNDKALALKKFKELGDKCLITCLKADDKNISNEEYWSSILKKLMERLRLKFR